MRRHGHDELAGGLQLCGDRRDRGAVVVDVLDHVERADQIVLAVGHAGELGQRRGHDLAAKALLGTLPGLLVELERVDFAEAAEHRKIVAGSAADLEDVRTGWRLYQPIDERSEHLPTRPVPPVALVELRHLIVDDALHQRKTSWRLSMKVASGVTKMAGTRGHQVGP